MLNEVELDGLKETCIRWRAHWRHLANTTEPTICGSDVALCRITLTTYHYYDVPSLL